MIKPSLLNHSIFTTTIAILLTLVNIGTSFAQGTSHTGLDKIVEIILSDERLQKRTPMDEIEAGAMAADEMNRIIIQAIIATGVGNDGLINTADTRELNDYIFENYREMWSIFHGDDENGEETGFHLVQKDGAKTKLFRKNAINRVADSIYHLGFESNRKNRLLNEDGNKNASFRQVSKWLNALLLEDLQTESLKNLSISEVYGSTGTGLDKMIDIIYDDERLQEKVSIGDIREAATSADAMNHILVEAINKTGVAANGFFSKDDVLVINQYILQNHQSSWSNYHGDDEAGEETGYHLVQRDGARTKLFGRNAINRVFDSIYHLGFSVNENKRRILNEDGNKNASLKKIALWLSSLYFDENT